MADQTNRRRRMAATSSWTVLTLILASGATAAAAQTPQQPAPASNPQQQQLGTVSRPEAVEQGQVTASPGEVAQAQATAQAGGEQSAEAPPAEDLDPDSANEISGVIVRGTRASLQSAIDRKRRAATNVDSIVAEDVSQFPDKNIGEALSRVTGVQLTREFGEGSQVSIRGVEPDLNRVEINGLSLLNNSGTGTRGASFQELASELVASIDVFKGFTADMTEGGVGGTVSIRTRKPLDLRKPLLSVTGSAQYLDIQESTKFRGNITAGNKFLDGRLGIIVNATFDDNDRRSDFLRNTEWNRFNTAVSAANVVTTSGDYDNSQEKTFVNPNYASVTSKAACPVATNATTAAEASACLQQWDDNLPRIPRYGTWYREDQRSSVTGTLQYRFNNNLTAFVEYTGNQRQEFLTDFNYQLAADAQHRINAVTYDRAGNPVVVAAPNIQPNRVAVVDDNHNVINFFTATRASTGATNTMNTLGASADRGSVNIFSTQTREFDADYGSNYVSGGFQWKSDNLLIDGVIGHAVAKQSNNTNNVQFAASIPDIHVVLSNEGVPSFTFPAGYDPNDPATYVKFATNGPGGTGIAYTSTAMSFQYRPIETDTYEDTVKLDIDYLVDMPFFSKFEAGYQYRDSGVLQYAGGGYTIRTIDPATGRPVNPIVVQGANVNHNFNIDPRAVTTGSASTNLLANPVTLTTTTTPGNLLAVINANGRMTPSNFFVGSQYEPGITIPAGWFGPDGEAALQAGLTNLSLFNHQLVRASPGRNAAGQIVGEFPQIPAFDIQETIQAGYLQTHFGTEIAGMRLSGNVGVRYVTTQTSATGSYLQRQIIANPAGGANITEEISTSIVTVEREYTDVLPSLNLQLDVSDKLVVRAGGARVMARPKPSDLRPNANCLFDRTPGGIGDADLDDCTAGNPFLEPYRANQYDLTVGYFADRDTLINASYFFKDVETFILQPTLRRGIDLFGDGNLFDVTQPVNAAGAKIHGLELSAQTAFTFLPAPFDGFGGIINYTYSKATNVGLVNAITFEELPFPGLSTHSYNIVAYYEKGPINARIAYNGRSEYLFAATDRSGNPVFRDPTGYLDGRVAYEFSPHLTVFAEGRNLTGEVERTTAGDIRLSEVAWSGKRYFVGFTWRN